MTATLRFAAVCAALLLPLAASAQAPQDSSPAAAAAPAGTTAAAAPHFAVDDTPLGEMLDNAAAKAVLDKDVPTLTASEQIAMARGMTLRAIQPYAQDLLTDDILTKVQADLDALSKTAPTASP